MVDKRVWLATVAGVALTATVAFGVWPAAAQEEREGRVVVDEVCDPLLEVDRDAVRTVDGRPVLTVGSEPCPPVVAAVEAPPAPPPPAPAAGPPRGEELVNFEFDESEIEPMFEDTLNRVAQVLNENPDLRVQLIGHTDAIGTEVYNIGLAERRAESVANYLQARGVRPEQLNQAAVGEGQPIATNETERGRFLNRRVEIQPVG